MIDRKISKAQRKRVLERDEKHCVLCHRKYQLQIHHYYNWSGKLKKVEDADANYPYFHTQDHDLITLCASCHGKIHTCSKASPIYKYLEEYLSQFYTAPLAETLSEITNDNSCVYTKIRGA